MSFAKSFISTRRIGRVFVLAAICLTGCGGEQQKVVVSSPVEGNLHAIREAYFKAARELGRPPRSKEELVGALKNLGDPVTLLRSPDDGNEFVIVYGTDPLGPDSIGNIWAYEKIGKDGFRWIMRGRSTRRISDESFR